MSLSIDQMRDLLGLDPEVAPEDVANAYALWLDGQPAAELLSLEEVKKHLKVELDDEDALIAGMIAAAIDTLEGEDGWLRRSITRQTRMQRFHCFRSGRLRLDYPPILSVTSVTYDGGAAEFATLDPALYELSRRELRPAYGRQWPSIAPADGAVRVTYEAGYTVLPPALRAALLIMIGDLYAQRDSFVVGTISTAVPMSTTVENLLAPLRVYT